MFSSCVDNRCAKEFFIGTFLNINRYNSTVAIYSDSNGILELKGPSELAKTVNLSPGMTELIQIGTSGPYKLMINSIEQTYIFVSSIESGSAGGFKVFSPSGESQLPTQINYHYFTVSVRSSSIEPTARSSIVLIGTENQTSVTLVPTGRLFLLQAALWNRKSLTINANERVEMTSQDDISGTEIISTSPLAVFSGHECGTVPNRRHFCDQLIEQIPPVSDLGKQYIVTPFAKKATGAVAKIIASADQTQIYISCSYSRRPLNLTLNKGVTHERTINSDGICFISSSQPIMVAALSFGRGKSSNNLQDSIGDPAMAILTSIENFGNETVFYSFPAVEDATMEHFATIITYVSDYRLSHIVIDNQPLSRSNTQIEIFNTFTLTVYDSQYIAVLINFDKNPGIHKVHSINGATFGLISYGFGASNGYAYSSHSKSKYYL